MTPFLCRIGWHKWKLSNGIGYSRGNGPMAVFYERTCLRCGRAESKVMVL